MDGTSANGAARAPAEPDVRCYEASAEGGARWREALRALRTRAEPPLRDHEVLLDSFDGRLRASGLGLSARGRAPRVVCRLAGRGTASSEVELATVPRFAWDFPRPQALELAHALEARGVEPIGRHELALERWAVLDDQDKVVAWIDEERHRVRPVHARAREDVLRVALRGVRGYGGEFRDLARALERADGLRVAKEAHFDPLRLLAEPLVAPGAWPKLAPRSGAFRALARIARAQLEAFEANAQGIRPGADAEHLHDARVALRRLRSLLGQLKGLLAAETRLPLVDELRWLASVLGPARDLDTLLLELRLAEMSAELRPVAEALEQDQALQYGELRRTLDASRCGELVGRLRALCAARANSELAGPEAAFSFAQVLARPLWRRFRQVVEAAARVAALGPSAELHELRIACKKLRYLLECCRGLVPRAELALAFADLKGLQSVLGTIQDTRVHAELLNTLAPALFPRLAPEAALALGRFQEQTVARGRAACAHYVGLRDAFLTPASRARFERLLRALGRKRRTR
jgi:CHAD domain-containing protein